MDMGDGSSLVWDGMGWACFGGRRKPGGVDDVEMPTNRPPFSFSLLTHRATPKKSNTNITININIAIDNDNSIYRYKYCKCKLYYTIPARLQ